MAAYRADIEIGVRGQRALEQLRSSINQTATAVNSLNDVMGARGALSQSVQNYTNNLNRAAASLRNVGAGIPAETRAIREYVRALGEANTARARQNYLIAQETANQRQIRPGTAAYGQQMPALPPAVIRGQQIQQNWNRFFTEATQVAQELQAVSAAKQTNIKASWNRFFTEATQVAQELQAVSAAKQTNIKASWTRFFAEAQEVAVELTVQAQKTAAAIRSSESLASAGARQRLAGEAARRQSIQNAGFGMQGPAVPPAAKRAATGGARGRLGDIAGNAIIGGAFPLLFGQGGGAAAGGAIGGLVGGAFGGVGGFAGSLVGTVIGDIAAKGDKVRQLAEDIGFSAEQTKVLERAFTQAGREFDKFESSVQAIRGVGLAINDQASAINAASQLAETYGGKIDKITAAFASALANGKVTQATLNQLTQQGIPIQEKLATTYGVTRSQLLTMAKEGKVSVQQLADAFVSLANEAAGTAPKIPTAYETAFKQVQQSVNDLVSRVSAAFNVQTNNMAGAFDNAVSRIGNAISQLIARLTPLIEKIAAVTAFFVDLGVKAATALLSIPNFIESIATSLLYVIPGLGQMLALLDGIQKITGGGKGAKTAADYGRYAPGFMQQSVTGPIAPIATPGQLFGAAGNKGKGAGGAKPPEDRSAELQDDLKASQLISITQDGIRDALFEGNKALAIRLDYDQKVHDITRDTAKALRNANYETEKAVIRAQEIVRIKDAELERDDQLRDLARDISTAYEETFASLREGVDWSKGFTFPDTVREFIKTARTELEDLQTVAITVAQGIGSAIGNTFTNGLVGLLTGAATVKSVFADLLQSVGDILAREGARMIATYIAIGIAKAFAGLGGGNIFNGDVGVDTFGKFGMPGLEGAGALGTGFPLSSGGAGGAFSGVIPGFAKGGYAAANMPAIVGENGPELFLPRTGGGIVPNNELRDAMAAGATSTAPVLNMSFETTSIGGVEYVSRDQLEAAMAATRRQAARDGAKRGMSMTLDKLQQSPNTRGRLGLR